MKIMHIVFSMTFLFLFMTSIVFADDSPLKVEATFNKKMPGQLGIYEYDVKITNVSNINQEFYIWGCNPEYSFTIDTPSIEIYYPPSYLTSCYSAQPNKVILKPFESYKYYLGGDISIGVLINDKIPYKTDMWPNNKTITFKFGFTPFNQDGKKDTFKEAIWSNSLNISVQ